MKIGRLRCMCCCSQVVSQCRNVGVRTGCENLKAAIIFISTLHQPWKNCEPTASCDEVSEWGPSCIGRGGGSMVPLPPSQTSYLVANRALTEWKAWNFEANWSSTWGRNISECCATIQGKLCAWSGDFCAMIYVVEAMLLANASGSHVVWKEGTCLHRMLCETGRGRKVWLGVCKNKQEICMAPRVMNTRGNGGNAMSSTRNQQQCMGWGLQQL